MRNLLISATLAVASLIMLPAPAAADDVARQNEAIALCRAEVAELTGVERAQVRLDQVRVRPSHVRVDLDLWRAGHLTNIRCDVEQDGERRLATISPALTTATAEAAAPVQP